LIDVLIDALIDVLIDALIDVLIDFPVERMSITARRSAAAFVSSKRSAERH
jgi:hypothetical protein